MNTPTPMMAQWQECKEKVPGAILFFRLGDFYEAFHDDAVLISQELDLTLTKRQEIPMAGVPFHMGDQYVDKLVAKGHKVAIAEQLEDPRKVKGIVKRGIVRIVTPGSVINSDLLTDKSHNYFACIVQVNQFYGLSFTDITTSQFHVMQFENAKALLDELSRLSPKELLLSEKWKGKELLPELRASCPHLSFKEDWHFEHRNSLTFLLNHFKVQSLDGFGLQGQIAAINAAGGLLSYLKQDLQLPTNQIDRLQNENFSSCMGIDRSTQRNLELINPLNEGNKTATLFHLLDETATPMGGRLLKEWILHPLLDPHKIQQRQDCVHHFFTDFPLTSSLSSHMRQVRDLERLIMRIETGYASPRDLAGLRYSLEQIPHISALLKTSLPQLLNGSAAELSDTSSITQIIAEAIVSDPPFKLSDGGVIKKGFHQELDELRGLKDDSHSWMAQFQSQLKESTGIKSLKVGYTKAFGYYIEVSRGASDKIPDYFQRRQTLVNNERFITEELKDFEHKILTAEERILALEQDLFHEIRRKVALFAPKIRKIATALAHIDCLCAFAKVALRRSYVRPIVDESDRFEIQEGRHPVIEAEMLSEHFIPNSIALGEKHPRLILITGPNMAGKSTYLRQTALLAIMAQIGSFVPAKSAHMGVCDKVFCRIGASDDLSRGQSTFMVEMTETANILNNATTKSLVILDEIGRGTSTYDGISIAWAVAEYLLTTTGKKAKTLFATHYWELTELEKKIPQAANFHVAVHEKDQGIVFLRKIVPGSTNKSYGIHVARLAGLPAAVIAKAEQRLNELEKNEPRAKNKSVVSKQQMDLF